MKGSACLEPSTYMNKAVGRGTPEQDNQSFGSLLHRGPGGRARCCRACHRRA